MVTRTKCTCWGTRNDKTIDHDIVQVRLFITLFAAFSIGFIGNDYIFVVFISFCEQLRIFWRIREDHFR